MSDDVTVPKEPSIGRLMSMAIRDDHALGMPGYYDQPLFRDAGHVGHARRVECAIGQMRQLYEEATGQGFYSENKEGDYAAIYEASIKETKP